MGAVLIVKAPRDAEQLLWLDRLCHGLLTWGFHRGLPAESAELLCVAPERASVEKAYVWSGSGKFPWKKLPPEAKAGGEYYWEGAFSSDELQEGQKQFKDLRPFKGSPLEEELRT